LLWNAAFRATLHHSALRGTTSHDAALVLQLLWQIRTKLLGQATLLHKIIHVSAATVKFCVSLLQRDFLIYGYHSAHYAWTVHGNSVESPWAKPKRLKVRSAAPVQMGDVLRTLTQKEDLLREDKQQTFVSWHTCLS
jgi:hypothetical protein